MADYHGYVFIDPLGNYLVHRAPDDWTVSKFLDCASVFATDTLDPIMEKDHYLFHNIAEYLEVPVERLWDYFTPVKAMSHQNIRIGWLE